MKKLKKEDVYVNLQGKSEEELTELYWLLKNNNEILFTIDLNRFLEYTFFKLPFRYSKRYNNWCCGEFKNKQEVTIQQLKEILQPMESKELKKGDKVIITDFGEAVTRNFTLNKPYVLFKDFNKENGFYVEEDDNNDIRNGWINAFELGIKIELYEEPTLTLTEQLEKVKAELKRVKQEIEDSKIKVGDFCVMDNGDYKFIAIFEDNDDKIRGLNIKKITNQELINKLNDLINER